MVVSNVVSTCQADGQWSKNVMDYKCVGKEWPITGLLLHKFEFTQFVSSCTEWL